MHPRRPSSEHQEAVSRRLALLSAELAAVRPGPVLGGEDDVLAPGPPAWRPAPEVPHGRAPDVAEAPAVPVPGRHASRRVGRVVADAIPETLRGRVLLGPGQIAVVAVLVALGLAVTCWWVVRSDSGEVVAPVAPAPAGSLVSAAPPGASSGSSAAPLPVGATGAPSAPGGPEAGPAQGRVAGSVTVDVAGKVRRPGIAVLDAGARVVDALRAAGGARRGVDLSALNLARPLVDGEQILVGVPTPPGLVASAAPAAGAAAGPLVNLNTASQEELETLPDVGPVTAEAIIAWRTEHGGYTAVDELLEVDGIGDATLSKLAPHVTV
jgi:competence protein ComEA